MAGPDVANATFHLQRDHFGNSVKVVVCVKQNKLMTQRLVSNKKINRFCLDSCGP